MFCLSFSWTRLKILNHAGASDALYWTIQCMLISIKHICHLIVTDYGWRTGLLFQGLLHYAMRWNFKLVLVLSSLSMFSLLRVCVELPLNTIQANEHHHLDFVLFWWLISSLNLVSSSALMIETGHTIENWCVASDPSSFLLYAMFLRAVGAVICHLTWCLIQLARMIFVCQHQFEWIVVVTRTAECWLVIRMRESCSFVICNKPLSVETVALCRPCTAGMKFPEFRWR